MIEGDVEVPMLLLFYKNVKALCSPSALNVRGRTGAS